MRIRDGQASGNPESRRDSLPARLDRVMFDEADLILFLQVIDEGSITGGARRAHLSLASASARIRAMETELGASLLRRHRRGVVPTPAGQMLAEHARTLSGQLARLRAD